MIQETKTGNTMNNEERSKIIRGALSKFKYKPKEKTWEDRLMQKAMDASLTIHAQIKPILESGGYFSDKAALQEMITRMYLELFDRGFDKEELAALCTMLHVEVKMSAIADDPYGTGKPPLLGGGGDDSNPDIKIS